MGGRPFRLLPARCPCDFFGRYYGRGELRCPRRLSSCRRCSDAQSWIFLRYLSARGREARGQHEKEAAAPSQKLHQPANLRSTMAGRMHSFRLKFSHNPRLGLAENALKIGIFPLSCLGIKTVFSNLGCPGRLVIGKVCLHS
jgi:hypothetical protein